MPGRSLCACLALVVLTAGLQTAPAASADNGLKIRTNQEIMDDLRATPKLAIDDPLAMFAAVLKGLPAEVKVYPTENYYYFWFHHGGQKYAGNIRLDTSDRDAGFVHFAYFVDYSEWGSETETLYRKLGPSDGVAIEKLEPLVYRVGFRGTSVLFRLNDLSKVKPPAGFLREDEKYLGPIFDESGLQFYLVYNPRLKLFHYFLNESEAVPEKFRAARGSSRLLVGTRTGFAFFRDRYKDRKILVGVHEANTSVNNYFDGPFDQLPDNFVEGDALRRAMIEVEPSLAEKNIDRFGNSPDGAERYLIGPYLHYRIDEDLGIFDDCAKDPAVPRDQYYACFVAERLQRDEPEAPKVEAPAATPGKAEEPGVKAPAPVAPTAPQTPPAKSP